MSNDTFRIDIRHNIEAFERRIDDAQRHEVPYVTAVALTRTAQDAERAIVDQMQRVFDRPTKFTLNSLYISPATKRHLVSTVQFKDGHGSVPAWRYLGPEVAGGARSRKSHERRLERAGILDAHEFVVPGKGAKLDGYGNMPGSEIERILSQLGAAEQFAGYTANQTARSRKRNVRKGTKQYFVMRGSRVPDGIYQRKGARVIVPVLLFVRAPQYSKRLPYYETAAQVIKDRFAFHFHEEWQRVMAQRGIAKAA